MSGRTEITASTERAAHLVLRVGRLLLENGADAQHARSRMAEVGALLGQPVRALVTPEAVIVTAGKGEQERTRIGPAISALGVDMARLGAVEQVLEDLRAGKLAPDDLDGRFDAAERAQGHPDWLVVLGVAVTAASLARIFGADGAVVAAAFVAGIVSTILRRALGRCGANALAATFLVALVSGLVAAFIVRLEPGTSAVFALTAAGMILVPGVPLVNGVRDLADGHVGLATARLVTSTFAVLAIGLALFLAAGLAGSVLPVGEGPGRLPVWEDLIFSATAAIGYSMLFNVPIRLVPICMVCSMASHGLRTGLAAWGVDLFTSSLLGALAAGSIAAFAARRYRVPPVTFAFPGIVAMIPGSYGFRAGIGGLQLMSEGASASPALVAATLSLIFTTATMTLAIGIGLALSLALVPARRSSIPPLLQGN